tara:strand:- start:666 stop:1001 length:336 start_codon:yes stop_codon:yes gene_type:complete
MEYQVAHQLQQDHQTYLQDKLWQHSIVWVKLELIQNPRKHHKVEASIHPMQQPLGIRQRKDTVGKANRIIDGKRNHNIPVDMSDDFYDNGNEYCRYLITDPRADKYLKKRV